MKNDLRVAVTKRMIKETLLELLKTKPLSKIRIKELCEKSRVNRATFYRHYDSLQDTLHEIEADFMTQLPLPKSLTLNNQEALEHMKVICSYFYAHADLLKLLFTNRTDSEMIHVMSDYYWEILRERQKNSPLQKIDDDTEQLIVSMLGGGGQCLLRKWILEDIPKTPDEIAVILCNIIRWPESYEELQKMKI